MVPRSATVTCAIFVLYCGSLNSDKKMYHDSYSRSIKINFEINSFVSPIVHYIIIQGWDFRHVFITFKIYLRGFKDN